MTQRLPVGEEGDERAAHRVADGDHRDRQCLDQPGESFHDDVEP
jgi:hypothetical protein